MGKRHFKPNSEYDSPEKLLLYDIADNLERIAVALEKKEKNRCIHKVNTDYGQMNFDEFDYIKLNNGNYYLENKKFNHVISENKFKEDYEVLEWN